MFAAILNDASSRLPWGHITVPLPRATCHALPGTPAPRPQQRARRAMAEAAAAPAAANDGAGPPAGADDAAAAIWRPSPAAAAVRRPPAVRRAPAGLLCRAACTILGSTSRPAAE